MIWIIVSLFVIEILLVLWLMDTSSKVEKLEKDIQELRGPK